MKKKIHLLCNAHLDPVWLWEWQEGAAEAISTFRVAADCCEEFDGFIFNHNEVTLYKWVEEYEPALFKRIQKLVKQGKWHIMGGWYLQPDCNMPSGESFVRQALMGKLYFKEKFNVDVPTALNFDPFGHSWGLPQILAKSGSDSYLFCRPAEDDCHLPADEFIWVGCDGSEVMATRVAGWYSSQLGKASKKINDWIASHPDKELSIVLWGVGNHGGGPSRQDLRDLHKLMRNNDEFEIFHSTTKDYFKELRRKHDKLPRHRRDLNPWGVGCYTSQVRIKQKHREIENELYMVEKMCTAAVMNKLMRYPKADIEEALHDLLVGEFHDILPGSSIQPVEEASVRMFDHGLEILSRLKARAFFSLASGEPKAREGDIPVMVYNPHPYPIDAIVECEFQLPDANWDEACTVPSVYQGKRKIDSQLEKELSNLNLDWRKRMVFQARLEPSQMNRFDCRPDQVLPAKPAPKLKPKQGKIHFKTKDLDVAVNTRTGLIDRYRVKGKDILAKDAFQPLVIEDNEDPWGMLVRSYSKVAGKFKLMPKQKGTEVSGVTRTTLPSVRVIEDGDVRTVVEVMLQCDDSFICQRYKLPKVGTEMEVEVRVHWNEKNRMLKLAIPPAGRNCDYRGQTAFGVNPLPTDGTEAVAQKWVAVVDPKRKQTLTCINDCSYGSDYSPDHGLRLSLIRGAAYSGHPFWDRPIVPQDQYTPRIDQGERIFHFWINGGPTTQRLKAVDREALIRNEKPFALSFFPPGQGQRIKTGPILEDDVCQISCLKPAEKGNDLIVRVYEPTGRKRSTTLRIPAIGIKKKIELGAFEVKTFKINQRTRKVREVNLIEKTL